MKKKLLNSMRMFLVAAGLLVGANAWAEDVYTEVYQRTSEAGTNQWSADDVTAWGSAANLAIDANNYLGFSGKAGEASYDLTITTNAKVKYVAEWYFQSTANDQTNPATLRLGSLAIKVRDSYQSNLIAFSTDGGTTFGAELSTKKTAKWVRNGQTVTVTAILNSANNTVESLSISFDGNTYTTSNLSSLVISAGVSTIGLKSASSGTWTPSSLLKSITVSECEQDVTNAAYTINYQLGGTTVKTVAGTSIVGAEITAETAIDGTEEGYVGNHYLATAAVAPSMVLVADAASNVLNVPVRAPYTATVNVTTTFDGVAQTPVATVFTETDAKVCDWNYFWSKYTEKDGKFYIANDVSKFGETGTFTDGQTINKTVAYTLAPTVAAYMEAESANTNSSNNTSYSGGKTGYVKGGYSYSLGTLPAGTYNLAAYLQDRGDRGIYLRNGSTTGTEIINLGTDKNSAAGVYDSNFTITENTALYLTGYTSGTSTNQCANIDYILITAVSVPVEVTAAGWATLYTVYSLDFSTTGLTAYTATIDGSTVTLTEVENVPANTGVVLKGDAKAYNIPVITSSTTAQGDLTGNATEATAFDAFAGYDLYMLALNGEGKAQFTKTTSGSIVAGKAFLKVSSSSARVLNVVFDNETTGINNVNVNHNDNWYDLQGRRVAAPQKGLYIVNGKKVVIK